jgi:RNA-directed DNA polymerase
MARAGIEMVRYTDDFVVLCRNEPEARHALELVRVWTTSVGLVIHPEKTHVVDASQRGGFGFLGYHFERGLGWPARGAGRSSRTRSEV